MKNYLTLPVFAILVMGCFSREPEKTGYEGKSMPTFKLLLADSLTYLSTGNIPVGKPAVLFYFGPDCPYSRAQMEEIIDNIDELKNVRFYIFTTWEFPEMKKFYNHYRLFKYSNITMGVDYLNFFKYYFKTKGVPYLAIYNNQKILQAAFVGKVPSRQIRSIAVR
jgi:thiol-disulfide isomerase/thioredoxin